MIQITTQKDNQQSTVTADDMARYKKQLDIMKAATKKYQKLPTNAAAETKYKMKMTAYADKMKVVKKQIGHVKKAKQTAKTKKTLSALNKKMSKLKKQYNQAKSNYGIKKKAAKADTGRSKVLTKLKKSDLFKTYAYIIPNNPQASGSYVFIFEQDESVSHGNTPATQPVEHGVNIVTTTQMNTPTIGVSGTIGGRQGDTIAKLTKDVEKMERWSDSGIDMRWHGQRQVNHVLLSDFQSDINMASGSGDNVINVTFTLTIATYFDSNIKKKKAQTKDTGNKSTTKGTKGNSKKNDKNSSGNSTKSKAHKYVTAKRGYTYWYVAQKTGVKLSVIEKLNNYADRQIPIGSKIYYS